LFLSGLVASVVLLDFRRVLEIGPEAGFFAAVSGGLYLTLVGAILVAVGIVLELPALRVGKRAAAQMPPST
jgi:hypothetical protein